MRVNSYIKKYFSFWGYLLKIRVYFIWLCAPVISKLESKKIEYYSSMELKHQPVFIIGAPRTGSTILYQTITNQLDVLYIDNLICILNNNLFFGFWLSDKIFHQKPHNCFESKLGNTKGCGWRAPSECGGFWYRWLPKNKHVVEVGEYTEQTVKQIRSEIAAVINYYDKPLVINNNNAALRLELLKEIFPDAKYIVADRDPIFVAQSLLLARKEIYGDFTRWWSMKPRNYSELVIKSPASQVVCQHYFINKQMYHDLSSLVDSAKWLRIEYSDLSSQKKLIIEKVKELIGWDKEREDFKNNEILENTKIIVDRLTIDEIEREIGKRNWNDYSSKT